jgi:hypothetical protein
MIYRGCFPAPCGPDVVRGPVAEPAIAPLFSCLSESMIHTVPMSNLIASEDMLLVANFMQSRLPANRLVTVARGIAALAPALWGHHPAEEIIPLRLAESILVDDPHIQLIATESEPAHSNADDGSALGTA